jgi:hypothetical protein
MNVNIREQIDGIETREDLARFIRELSKECQADPNSWENNNLESFLEALAGWIEDMEGAYKNQNQPVPATPKWKTFARMLSAARYYE